ncbi:uncharacterized protein BXIN_2518 [Babesia sp. Xinjiang]|uniref:uncharacterized protein n=1 Tax=Babesia sp. Xinjiang TaxID=462227 RepID=UPI000A22A8A1|nr:uncharacterized protein BXIN_2518 [Babesia sp. Xinjiang]ORM41421.1 hypothetical protein BXIN_2518 [Babesia sp. Xinjiang]
MASCETSEWPELDINTEIQKTNYRLMPWVNKWLRYNDTKLCKCCACQLMDNETQKITDKDTKTNNNHNDANNKSMRDWVEVSTSTLRTKSTVQPGYHERTVVHSPVTKDLTTSCRLKNKYQNTLKWICRTIRHLDALERQSFGQEFRRKQLQQLRTIDQDHIEANSDIKSTVEDTLRQWITFDTQLRRVYAEISRTYKRLIRMELHLNLLRTNSLLMMEDEIQSSNNVNIQKATGYEHIVESERYGKLVSIWSSKLAALRDRNLNEFRQYVISAVADLRLMPVPRAVTFVENDEEENSLVISDEEDDDITRPYNATASFEIDVEDNTETEHRDNEESTSKHSIELPQFNQPTISIEGVPEYTLDTADVNADCYDYECTAHYNEIYEDAMKLVTDYCQDRGINEENPVEYVNRVRTLNNRLLPHILKVSNSIPIHSNEYLNQSINCITESDTTLTTENLRISRSSSIHWGSIDTEAKRELPTQHNGYLVTTGGTTHKSSARNGINTNVECNLPTWALHNGYVELLRRTNLTVVNALRCMPNSSYRYRKLVCLSRGNIADLFRNRTGVGEIETVDVGSLLTTDSPDKTSARNVKAVAPSLCGPQTVLRALLTEDLASYEIDKIIQCWFPPLSLQHSTTNSGIDLESEELMEDDIDGYSFALGTEADELHIGVWRSRLAQFDALTGRQISRLLRDRKLVEPRVKYDSSGYPNSSDFIPLSTNCNFRNHIPIKYTMKTQMTHGESHYVWMQSLFGGDLDEGSIQDDYFIPDTTETNSDVITIMCSNNAPNAVVIPIHRGSIDISQGYRTIAEMSDCVTDYVFPPLYEQHRFAYAETNNDGICSNSQCDKRYEPGHYCNATVDTTKIGNVFISRHSSLYLGSQWTSRVDDWDRTSVPVVFYLVSCEGPVATDTTSGDPDSPETVLEQLERMRPVLAGLDHILNLCVYWKVNTLTIPAALSCCLSTDNRQQIDTSNVNEDDTASLRGDTYMRCLATATHLTTGLCRNPFPRAVNMIFPEELHGSGVESAVASIFANRLGTF